MKKNWLEREREVAERRTERGSGVTEIGLSGEGKFCRSRSAHMLWYGSTEGFPFASRHICVGFSEENNAASAAGQLLYTNRDVD